MDGLESTQALAELLERVPASLDWALCEELPDGYEVWVRTDCGAFVQSGTLDTERLRLGVSRVLSGITRTSSAVVFRLRGSDTPELPCDVVNIIVQAALWGEIRIRP